MAPSDTKSVPPYERLLFWLRWAFWAVVALIGLLSESAGSDGVTMGASLAIVAGANILIPVLWRLGLARAFLQAVFDGLDVALLGGLIFLVGVWPTPWYPLVVLAIVLYALRTGILGGLGAGVFMGLAGLGAYALQSAEQMAALSVLDLVIALAILPALGALVGYAGRLAASDTLHTLHQELGELRSARERSDAMYALASTLGATLNYQKVLETLFDVSAIEFRAIGLEPNGLVGMALLYEDRLSDAVLRVAYGHNLPETDWGVICEVNGVLSDALATTDPLLVPDVGMDAGLCQFAGLRTMRSAILVPLSAGFHSYGLILFASSADNAFSLERCHFLSAFASQVTIALQNARLFDNLRAEQNRIMTQQEEVRRQLARDLHDGPTQAVASVAMRLNYVRMLLNHDPSKAAQELADLEDLARMTSKEIRTMLFTLRPVVLETQGLGAALRQYGERLRETDGLSVLVEDSQFDVVLNDDMAGVVFSILEEAINNARKYAQSERVTVTLRRMSDTFVAEVKDDGIGFDVAAVQQNYDQRGSLGLLNMRERAGLIDGSLTIRSRPGQGTTVTLAAPLERAGGSGRARGERG